MSGVGKVLRKPAACKVILHPAERRSTGKARAGRRLSKDPLRFMQRAQVGQKMRVSDGKTAIDQLFDRFADKAGGTADGKPVGRGVSA